MFLTFEQARRLVHRSSRTVRYWIEKGYLKPVLRGQKHWYRKIDVLEAERRVRRRLPPGSLS